MLWYKEWANSDAHPKVIAAGFWGATVFRVLCRASAEFDLNGRIPEQYASPAYLAHRLQLGPEFESLDPADATKCNAMQRGIDNATAAGLLVREGPFLLIDGWGDRQAISSGSGRTSTERSQDFRSRQKNPATKRNASPLHATLDKRRVDKRRSEEEEPPESASPPSAPDGTDAPVPQKPTTPHGRHAATIDLFVRLFAELRGGAYVVAGAKDGSAVKRLLSVKDLADDEIERRMRFAFADQWFRQHGTIADFVSRWSTWQPTTASGPPQKPRDPRIGSVRAEDCEHPDEPGWIENWGTT
jgi:hypothetical protein